MGMYVMFPKFLHAAVSNAGHGGIFVYKWLSIGSFYYFYNTNILVVTILLYFCKEKDSY